MKIKIMKSVLSVAVLAAMNSAWAAPIGTAAGTAVDNTASIVYNVGGTTQTPIESSETGNSTPGVGGGTPTTFVVDKKIDLLVTGGNTTNVVPGQTGASVSFTLTNEGNSTQDFVLTPNGLLTVTPGTNDFQTANCATVPAGPVNLASGAQVTVAVNCDVPASSATVTNGALTLVDLLATATEVGGAALTASTGADTAGCTTGTIAGGDCTVDVVFADGTGTGTDGADRNAKHSATGTYSVNTADLTVKKTEAVTTMALDLGINDATATNVANTGNGSTYHIPGSTIQYTIVVTNKAAEATHLVISDAIPAGLTYVPGSCALTGDAIVNVAAPSPALGCSITGTTVSSSSFTLPAGTAAVPTTATLTIDATVD